MGAFSIAFDIIVVGALALPWVFLVIHLFFSHNESTLKGLFGWVKDQQQPALAGILLFAMAFPLGSVVSRIAQDFFDDDDLHIQVFRHLLRVGVTESSIRTDVFCKTFKPEPPVAVSSHSPAEKSEQSKGNDLKSDDAFARNCTASAPTNSNFINPSKERLEAFRTDPKFKDLLLAKGEQQFRSTDPNCTYTGRWVINACDQENHQYITAEWIDDQQNRAGEVFHVHEATVLLKGTDATERIRQFHDQIVVLRGAAFNGMLAFSLCLFWWVSKSHSAWRWTALSPYLFLGGVASVNHCLDHAHDPPYMEFTLLVLAAAGGGLLWRRAPTRIDPQAEPRSQNARGEIRFVYLLLAAILTFTAFLGWWATQVLYDQQVIYSYKALSDIAPKSGQATSDSGVSK
jgi:hypothetical protein